MGDLFYYLKEYENDRFILQLKKLVCRNDLTNYPKNKNELFYISSIGINIL